MSLSNGIVVRQTTQSEHVLQRPDMYGGAVQPVEGKCYVYDLPSGKIVQRLITYSEFMNRAFLEILSNATDAVKITEGIRKSIVVSFRKEKPNYIQITNESVPISLAVHNDYISNQESGPITSAHLAFGDFFTSSKFDDDADVAGKNGLGAKLTKVTSYLFEVKCFDPYTGQTYTGKWVYENKKTVCVTSECQPGYTWNGKQWVSKGNKQPGTGYVSVGWEINEEFYKMSYTDDIIDLYIKYCFDAALVSKCPVYVTDHARNKQIKVTNVTNICKYAEFIHGNVAKVNIETKCGLGAGISVELCIFGTKEDESKSPMGFVNGLMCDNGIHINSVYEAIFEVLKEKVKSLKKEVVTNNISFIVSVYGKAPKHDSQTKTRLTNINNQGTFKLLTRENKTEVTNQILGSFNADFIKRLNALSNIKPPLVIDVKHELSKIDPNYLKATKRGGTLILVEGVSAMSYASTYRDCSNLTSMFGIYPVGGVPKNMFDSDDEHTMLKSIMCIVGLTIGVDYTIESNIANLYYSNFLIMADQDDDGKHITTLLIGMFYRFFPSIIAAGRLYVYISPLIRVGDRVFFSELSFKKAEIKSGCKVKYQKGLASSSDENITTDVNICPWLQINSDSNIFTALTVCLGSKSVNERKKMINKPIPELEYVSTQKNVCKGPLAVVPGSELVLSFYSEYTNASISRAIPEIDGFKESVRKFVYYLLEASKYGSSTNTFIVERFAAEVASRTAYHHGIASLNKLITRMGQTFVGANNLTVIEAKAQFGTRQLGGADAGSPRYISFKVSPILKYLFDRTMVSLIEKCMIDGDNEKTEPVQLVCDLPLHIINGVKGVASGVSTFIPPHKPVDVTRLLIDMCEGKSLSVELVPYWEGFKGTCTLKDKHEIIESDDQVYDENDEEDIVCEDDKRFSTYIVKGVYARTDNVINITDLPPGVKTIVYVKKLEELAKNHTVSGIKSVTNNSKANTVDIRVVVDSKFVDSHRTLKLIRVVSYSNMVVSTKSECLRYRDIYGMLRDFYGMNIQYYAVYKMKIIADINEKIDKLTQKQKYIADILSGKLIVNNRDISDVLKDMVTLNHKEYLLDEVTDRMKTLTNYNNLTKEIEKENEKLETIKNTPVETIYKKRLEEIIKHL